jgi:hypothetical protein
VRCTFQNYNSSLVNKATEPRNLPADRQVFGEIPSSAMTDPVIGIRTGRRGLPRPPSSGSQLTDPVIGMRIG